MEKKIWLYISLALIIGVFFGQFIGYHRAFNYFEPKVKNYKIDFIIADETGNATHIQDMPYACVVGENITSFYFEVLEPAFFKKDVCFTMK